MILPRLSALLSDPAGGGWALFLDIDGTLLDLADDPEAVRADVGLLDLLDQITVRLNGALALISGRDMLAVDRITAPRTYPAAASHGAELRFDASGETETGNDLKIDALRLTALAAEMASEASDGIRIETKTCAVVLHFRRRPDLLARVEGLAAAAVLRLGSGYRTLAGKDVREIALAGADKGAAIDHFLAAPPFCGRRPIFIGDDITDEDGFAAVNRRNGLSIRIGDRAGSRASHALASPAALRGWLTEGAG